jgi:hypothetical protein
VDPSPPPKPSPVGLHVVSKTSPASIYLIPSRSPASARRRQPRRPLAVRAAVAARAASMSPYLSLPRSQLRVGRNRAENRAPELEIKRAPASSAAGPAGRRCSRRRASPVDHPGRPIASGRCRLVWGIPLWPIHGGPVDRGPRRSPRLCQPPDPWWMARIGPTPQSTSSRCNLACGPIPSLNL